MALIDVSDLLVDPDFVDNLQVIRRTAAVNARGENVVSEPTTIATVGSIQPASAKQLQRLPEALRIADVRSFFINLPIVQDGSSNYPDVIVYGGKRFQVQTAAPWANYGAGWNEGICVAQEPSGG
jgi:hypothetical protein